MAPGSDRMDIAKDPKVKKETEIKQPKIKVKLDTVGDRHSQGDLGSLAQPTPENKPWSGDMAELISKVHSTIESSMKESMKGLINDVVKEVTANIEKQMEKKLVD